MHGSARTPRHDHAASCSADAAGCVTALSACFDSIPHNHMLTTTPAITLVLRVKLLQFDRLTQV
jgi:hypothetical protein